MPLKLKLPTAEHEQQVMDFRREFVENGERTYGAGNLHNVENFSDWLEAVIKGSSEDTVDEDRAPGTTFLAMDENGELVGTIFLRHRLDKFSERTRGHIAYNVKKSQRGKGYAVEMMELVKLEAKKLNLERCLITCNKDNIASKKTIEKSGGIFRDEVTDGDSTTLRYFIEIK